MNTLLEVSLYATLLTGAILLFRKLFSKQLSPALQYGIWFLLILRLCCPITLESGVHVFTLPAKEAPTSYRADYGAQPQLPAQQGVLPATVLPDMGGEEATASGTAAPISRRGMLCGVWVAGMLLQAAYYGAGLLKLWQVRRAACPPPAWVQEKVHACVQEMGLHTRARALVSGEIDSPMLLGRCILLPEGMLAEEEALQYALLHELAHIRRRDYLVLALSQVLQCVYWFHPVVRLGLSEMRADMETACDAAATAHLPATEKKAYYMLLIDLFSARPAPGLGMAQGTLRVARRRIAGAAMRQCTSHGVRVAAGVVGAVLLLACFTTACQPVQAAAPGPIHVDTQPSPAPASVPPGNTPAPEGTPLPPVPADTPPEAQNMGAGVAEGNAKAPDSQARELDSILARLEALGYPVQNEGSYTASAAYAVELFQRQNSLTMDGVLGEETRVLLVSENALPYAMQVGLYGQDVLRLQRCLMAKGYSISKATGYYGTETEAAVRAYQKANGLEETGIVRAALAQKVWGDAAGGYSASILADALVEKAFSMLEVKFVHGGRIATGVDCGGLVYYCLNEIGIPTNKRTSAHWLESEYPTIGSMEELLPGDIICFEGHVGIYAGDGMMIDASSSTGKVVHRSIYTNYWERHFVCGKRVV